MTDMVAPMDEEPTLLVWLDSMSHGNGGWGRLSEYRKNQTPDGLRHESVGWIFYEDAESVSFCSSRGVEHVNESDFNISDIMQIPKVAILERITLAPKKR